MQNLADLIGKITRTHRGGSLAFFGCWFGGRPDGIALISSVEAFQDALIIKFREGEVLELLSPSEMEVLDDALIIWQVKSLTWSWNLYGEIPSPKNRHYYQFIVGSTVQASSNRNDYMIPNIDAPAFEMAWSVPHDCSGPEYYRERGKVRLPK